MKINYQFPIALIIASLIFGATSAKASKISDLTKMPIRCLKNPETVDRQYDDAVAEQQNEAKPYNDRGEAKMKIGDCDGALEDFDRALSLDPKFAPAYFNKGLLRLGSISIYTLEEENKNPLEELFSEDGGIENFSKALSLDSRYIEDYESVVSFYPNNAKAYAFRGIGKYIVKDLQGSLSDFDRAVKMEPTNDLFYYYRSVIKYAMGDRLASKKDRDRGEKLYRSLPGSGTRGAVNYYINYIQSVPIHLNPHNVKAHWQRAESRFAIGAMSSALADYQRIIELQPNNPYAYYQAAGRLRADATYTIEMVEGEQDNEKRVRAYKDLARADEYLARAKRLINDRDALNSLGDFGCDVKCRNEIAKEIQESE